MFSTDVNLIRIDAGLDIDTVLVPVETWREIVEFCRRHGETLPSFDRISPLLWRGVTTFGDDVDNDDDSA